MKRKKIAALLLVSALAMGSIAGCGGKEGDGRQSDSLGQTGEGQAGGGDSAEDSPESGGEGEDTQDKAASYIELDHDITGDLSILCWSGDGEYHEDIGHQNWAPEDITAINVASIYAMAKKFNETYPNVTINLYAMGDWEGSWSQQMENFKAQYGKYPDIWATQSLIEDVEKGLAADLSVFADDPVYQSFNPAIMNMMNYYGMQAGLPQYMVPHGVFVNKDLAEQNNIDVPDPDWTIDDYTLFISQSDNVTFWGAMDIPRPWVDTGTKDITYMMTNYTGEGDHVNLDSDAVKELLSLIPKWAENTVWTQNDVGAVPQEIMDENGWSGHWFFSNGYILTWDGDPWNIGVYANSEPQEGQAAFQMDVYPRPATDYVGNTVGMVLDPLAVHNYAMDDGNPELSGSEEEKLKLAYTFAAYWVGSTEAAQARVDQQFLSGGILRTAANDSIPFVTGEEFDRQMEIWYSLPTHTRCKDMPGWKKCMELWEAGQIWDAPEKTYPSRILEDGAVKMCMDEWLYYYADDKMTAKRASDGWLDEIKSKLPEWNRLANQRFAEAEQQLKDALKDFYGYTEEDFK